MPINIDAKSPDLSDKGRAIIDAALSGEVTADVAHDLLMSLYAQGRLVELTEHERRLQALEGQQEPPPWDQATKPKPLLPLRGRNRRTA